MRENLCPILPPRLWVDADPGIGAYFCLQRLGEDMNWHAKNVDHVLNCMGCKGSQVRILSPRPIKSGTCVRALLRSLFWGTSGGTSNPSPETFDFLWWLLSCRSGPWR